ncbi:DUF2934 domain-containing protein [uncultured Thiodictyon sp.]|uniref:DUF2934 domain-containing protein n=1 Tax=uncultured Thiodictyon sp. TaxID=1846217 RepID=UPI0025E5211A|nr:DUF2934 domain-containing protein [uncultured Thiodictyon sp.]
MADNKSVTKKTADKPAAPTDTPSGATPPPKTTAAKPSSARPAAAPAQTKAAAAAAAAKASAAAAPPAPPTATKKVVAKKAAPGAPKANHKRPVEEPSISVQDLATVAPEQRLDMIREAAYFRAEKRGFTGGSDADDWAAAEREIDELLAKARQIYGG